MSWRECPLGDAGSSTSGLHPDGARGVRERRVVTRHALRYAIVAILPVLGLQAGFVLSGAVYIEIVFQWPGIGRMLVDAILTRDIMLVQGGVLFNSGVHILFNIIVDLAQLA